MGPFVSFLNIAHIKVVWNWESVDQILIFSLSEAKD